MVRNLPPARLCPHGHFPDPDQADIEQEADGTWNKIVEPKDDGLTATADIIGQNVESGVDAYVNVNKHYEGSAPLGMLPLAWTAGRVPFLSIQISFIKGAGARRLHLI